MECAICFNIISNSCIGSCTHHFCLTCLIRWCQNNGTACPICKTLIREIRPDIEFNKLNCPESPDLCTDNIGHKIIVDFSNNENAGITLENNCSFGGLGIRGPGVIVTKINQKDKCYQSGLRKGDTIIFINNIPCTDHKQSIDIIDASVLVLSSINCVLLKIKQENNNNNNRI